MKVSSPVGEFPFEIKKVSLKDGRLTLVGHMGAWPATIRIDRSDVPALVRMTPRLIVGLGRLAISRARPGD